MTRTRDFATMRRRSGSGLPLTLAAALALVVAAHQSLAARTELRQSDLRVTEARRDVGALRERLKQSEGRPGVAQAMLVRALAAESAPPAAVLRDLVALMPAGVRLDHLELGYGPEVEVEAAIVARGTADYDAFLDRLSASSRFGALEPGPETREGELHTTLRLVYRGGSGR